MTEYQELKMKITKGDVITSKKGILTQSAVSDNWYLVFKQEYLGDGLWRSIKKEECKAEQIAVEKKP